ncbi:MAG: hypothetical protein OXI69_15970 [Acidobacteriota bacterium]|nr:hypothetical protein [Acidobacteriota bacterium]
MPGLGWVRPRPVSSLRAEASRQNISSNPDLVSQAADQVGMLPVIMLPVIRNNARDRLAMLGDDQAVSVKPVQQGQALLPELCNSNRSHLTSPSRMDISIRLDFLSRNDIDGWVKDCELELEIVRRKSTETGRQKSRGNRGS